MKTLNYKAKSNVQDIVKRLDSTFTPDHGFIFNMGHDKNDSVRFKVRKRVVNSSIYTPNMNSIIVNGKLLKTDTENETDVEAHFTRHIFVTLYVFIYFVFALFLILLGIVSNETIYILLGGILFVIGIALWIDVKKKFKINSQKYKSLICEVLTLA